MPKAACAAVVVIAGNHHHRHPHGTDGTAGLGHIAATRPWGIKQIASHEHELGLVLSNHLSDARNGSNADLT